VSAKRQPASALSPVINDAGEEEQNVEHEIQRGLTADQPLPIEEVAALLLFSLHPAYTPTVENARAGRSSGGEFG
jgi:hypothetical protein